MAFEPTINPYAPPAADIDASAGPADDRFDRPLFSPGQIGVATFFGTVLLGVLMLQSNFRVMRRSGDANKALVLGLLAFAGSIALSILIPKGGRLPLGIAFTIAMRNIARSLQGQAFFRHTAAGGAKRSNWLVFGFIVAAIVSLSAAVMIAILAIKGVE